jgi:hypothetical protein
MKSELDFIMIQCSGGYIAAKRVNTFVLCARCEIDYNVGMIKTKLDTLSSTFQKQLKPIDKYLKDETYE